MVHTITKRLEIYIDLNIEISQVDHYTWIMRGYSLLENLISGRVLLRAEGVGKFFEKNKRLFRDARVSAVYENKLSKKHNHWRPSLN